MAAKPPSGPEERLRAYRAKRSVDRTPEPFGTGSSGGAGLFVVHLHGARRLHYDLRMEFDGVLVSWAVPKGPSTDPAEKRIAVLVEDHPIGYADFEGVIPPGNYGAGPMILWDRGTWNALEDPVAGIEKGKILFELKGYKLRGVWALVRIKGEKGNEWLLIKHTDAFSAPEGTRPYRPESILSGLSLEELRDGARRAEEIREALAALKAPRREVSPENFEVMLADTADRPFSDPAWLYELKYDGFRLLATKDGDKVSLQYRSGRDATAAFPEIRRSLGAWPYDRLILDGEVVVLGDDARPSFNRLQQRVQLHRTIDLERAMIAEPATLYTFDLIGFEGYDARPLRLEDRKKILEKIVPSTGPIRYSDHIEGQGEALYEQIRGLGLEGIIAKDRASVYRSGRSKSWLKIRTEQTADFAVVGFNLPKTTRTGFGALHLAVWDPDRATFIYSGRVGSGFDESSLNTIRAALEPHIVKKAPCIGTLPKGKEIVWVEPRFAAEVRYLEWTHDGLIRHSVFNRLRDDKSLQECVRRDKQGLTPEIAAAPPPPPPEEGERSPITNAEKIFWPADKFTKGDLYSYYRDIGPWVMTYLKDRPVVVVRYPDGIEGKSFFQKDAPGYVPGWMRTEKMWSEQAQKEIDHFIADDVDALLYLVNLGTIPLHVWSSRAASLQRPDWCILDLDPKGAPFTQVVQVAIAVKAVCDQMELPCFAKTSGSTGMHVLIPLGGQFTFEQARTLAELIARVVAQDLPEISTVARAVNARGGRVYLDFLQNGNGKLLVAPFSARPIQGAPVSMPVEWEEVTPRLDPTQFTIKTAVKRLEKMGEDPMSTILSVKPNLPRALERLAARKISS